MGTINQHAEVTIVDVPPKHVTGVGFERTDRVPSSLDMGLRALADKGIKVLNFWRGGKGWIIKVMVPR